MPTASFVESISHFCLPLFLLPSIFSSIIIFSNPPLPSHDVPEAGQLQFYHFPSRDVSGLVGSRTHLFIFLVVQCIRGAKHISNESIFSPYQPSSLSNFLICA